MEKDKKDGYASAARHPVQVHSVIGLVLWAYIREQFIIIALTSQ